METQAGEFVTLAREHLTVLEQLLLSLEKPGAAAEDRERLDGCLRLVHSLKGDAGFLGFTAVRTLANAMETVLETMRDQEAPVLTVAVERLLLARDRLATLVDDLDNSHGADLRDILAQLSVGPIRQQLGLPATAAKIPATTALSLSVDLGGMDTYQPKRSLVDLLAELGLLGDFEDPASILRHTTLRTMLPTAPIVLRGRLRTSLSRSEVDHRLLLPTIDRDREAPTIDIAAAPLPLTPRPESRPPVAVGPVAGARHPSNEEDKTASLRVNVELLDRLMTLIGELTLIRNQSLLACEQDDSPLRPIVQRLSAVTSSLQETVLRTRMQPVGNLFGKFPRVVRDLGRQLGKQVEITIVGRDVELDKTILEQLADPLTHLVRNSVDHGIETPEERAANGKPLTGQIALTASHEDGQVRIDIREDGRGIDPAAVRAKALAMRLKTESELDRMSPRELFALILLPGFSTARQVTEVSGRGVGMDVVKTNIELLEGSLTIDSQLGAGTAMILRMPLTLAIIPCLIASVNGERYAIPQRELEEAICLHPGLKGRIEQAFDTEFYRLRERLLPIIRLREVFDNPRPFTAETKGEILKKYAASNREPVVTEYIVVVRHGGKRFGLLVDEVRGTEEIVVKPMNVALKGVDIFTGATIMGDGRVALIANVAGIVEHARISFETELPAASAAARSASQTHRFLLFEYGPRANSFAMPLLRDSPH